MSSRRECGSGSRTFLLLLLAWLAIMLVSLAFGPRLGDHEVIVAQIARQTLESGDWVVPRYLDLPFLMKPPLTPWLISVLGIILPNDGLTGLPVTTFAARIPSALATVLTVWIVWCLARSMFRRRTAGIAAFVCATALGSLLYAVNATAEALLTAFCTWAFAEFWWSQQAGSTRGRRLHMLRFYVALGLAMLAKGPMPLIVVAMPLAIWWWCERPTRLLAGHGRAGVVPAVRLGFRQLPTRLWQAIKGLSLWWGVPLFLAWFVPWMFLVARREPFAWSLWNYEYLDRAKGDYPGSHPGHYAYYLPLLFGLLIPWCLSLPEALISPFREVYRHERRPLVFAWFWVLVGLVILSMMSFKKPYYVLPLLPGCTLLLAPVLDRFFFGERRTTIRWQWVGVWVAVGGLAIGMFIGLFVVHTKYSDLWHGVVPLALPAFAVLILAAVAAVGVLYVRGWRRLSLAGLGGASVLIFSLVWCILGPSLSNADTSIELVRQLDKAGVPPSADLYWGGNRPDGSVRFYSQRTVKHVVDPYLLVTERSENEDADDLRFTVGMRLCSLFKTPEPVYVVFQRGEFEALRAVFNPPARELFSVDRGKVGEDEDDWVVATNVLPVG